jgi:Rieske 2Fe-2S family protein
LPARFYTDPAYFRSEFERYFARGWACVGHASALEERGRYFLAALGDESLIVVLGADGQIRAHFNVCRHRGTRICSESHGRLPSTIQCPYHAWTWDLSGKLVGAPHMDDCPGFDRADWPLKQAEVGLWDGHIFVRLEPGGPPLQEQLGTLPATFAPWGMAGLRPVHRVDYDVAANWKLILQNYSECLHCPVIHPALGKLSHYLSGDNEPAAASHLGGFMTLREGVATMNMDGKARRPNLPGLSPEQCRRVYFFAVLPNLFLSLHPDYMLVHRLRPLACDRTEIVCEWYFHPDATAREGFDPSDAVEFWDLTNRQDWQVSELTQLGMKSRAYEPGPYSSREELLFDFDRRLIADSEG